MSYTRGDKVMVGSPYGEKTLAEVVRVNKGTVTVRLLERRGTQRTWRVGARFRFPPSMIEPAPPDRVPQKDKTPDERTSPTTKARVDVKPGEHIQIGAPLGKKTDAKVVRANVASVTVKLLEDHGRWRSGSKLRVPLEWIVGRTVERVASSPDQATAEFPSIEAYRAALLKSGVGFEIPHGYLDPETLSGLLSHVSEGRKDITEQVKFALKHGIFKHGKKEILIVPAEIAENVKSALDMFDPTWLSGAKTRGRSGKF